MRAPLLLLLGRDLYLEPAALTSSLGAHLPRAQARIPPGTHIPRRRGGREGVGDLTGAP